MSEYQPSGTNLSPDANCNERLWTALRLRNVEKLMFADIGERMNISAKRARDYYCRAVNNARKAGYDFEYVDRGIKAPQRS